MPRVLSFHYKLTDGAGKVLDSSEGHAPISFIEGSGQIIPGLEKAMLSLKQGDKRRVEVPMAGKNLLFDIELTGSRLATDEELSHGHAHGEHGHSH